MDCDQISLLARQAAGAQMSPSDPVASADQTYDGSIGFDGRNEVCDPQ